MEKTTVVNRPAIEVANVASVYSGKAGHCMCGCSGKHTYASAHRYWSGRERGYLVTDDEINDRTVKTIAGKVSRSEGVEVIGKSVRSVEIGKRIYAVYMRV